MKRVLGKVHYRSPPRRGFAMAARFHNIKAYILRLNGALPGSQPLTESTHVPINRLAK